MIVKGFTVRDILRRSPALFLCFAAAASAQDNETGAIDKAGISDAVSMFLGITVMSPSEQDLRKQLLPENFESLPITGPDSLADQIGYIKGTNPWPGNPISTSHNSLVPVDAGLETIADDHYTYFDSPGVMHLNMAPDVIIDVNIYIDDVKTTENPRQLFFERLALKENEGKWYVLLPYRRELIAATTPPFQDPELFEEIKSGSDELLAVMNAYELKTVYGQCAGQLWFMGQTDSFEFRRFGQASALHAMSQIVNSQQKVYNDMLLGMVQRDVNRIGWLTRNEFLYSEKAGENLSNTEPYASTCEKTTMTAGVLAGTFNQMMTGGGNTAP